MFLIPIFCLILIKTTLIHCNLFTSTTHLTELLNTEIELVKKLEIYLKQEYERLERIEKFINIIKDEIDQAQENEEYYFGNPVNSHLLIKHLTVEWNKIEKILPTNFSKNISDNWLFPLSEDYTGSAVALMRLQDTYKLNPSQLANGQISSTYKSKKLSALECYDLGRVAFENNDFYHTLMWMQEALDHFEEEIPNKSINKTYILDYLSYATFKQENLEHALDMAEEILAIDPDHVSAKNNKIYYEKTIQNRRIIEQQQNNHLNTNDSIDLTLIPTIEKDKNYTINNQRPDFESVIFEVYEYLCRQNSSQLSKKRQSKLFCRYRHNNHPYLILQPVKEEQLTDKPDLFLFHDIINDKHIQEIKSLAMPKLMRSTVVDSKADELHTVTYRVSKSAWLNDEDSPAVARLSRLIEAVTNLNIITAEGLQVVNYGVGGHYEPHHDYTASFKENVSSSFVNGDRIATWLTYLSDVEQGGATVFPGNGGITKPKKGSAVFWYNLHESGEGDVRTLHAGCPVLIGNKWIANKWLHEHGQEFRRPCLLDPMA